MLERQIFTAIAEKLLERGKCLYDPACVHSHGDRCYCPPRELEARLGSMEADISASPGHIGVANRVDPGPWPCDAVLDIVFTPEGGAGHA